MAQTVNELLETLKKLKMQGFGDYEVVTNMHDYWIGVAYKGEYGEELTTEVHRLKRGYKVIGFCGGE